MWLPEESRPAVAVEEAATTVEVMAEATEAVVVSVTAAVDTEDKKCEINMCGLIARTY